MKVSMKRRLEKIEQGSRPEEQVVIVLQQDGEHREEMPERLERWKAGEETPGVRSEKPYQGGNVNAFYVCFVKPGQA